MIPARFRIFLFWAGCVGLLMNIPAVAADPESIPEDLYTFIFQNVSEQLRAWGQTILRKLGYLGIEPMALARTFLWFSIMLAIAIFFVYGKHRTKATVLSRTHYPIKPASFGAIPPEPEIAYDVAATAWTLWQAGQPIESLGFLYRATLTKLTAQRRIEVKKSCTEEDAIRLIQPYYPPEITAYFKELTHTWEKAAYGGQLPETADLERLCEDWAQYFGMMRQHRNGRYY